MRPCFSARSPASISPAVEVLTNDHCLPYDQLIVATGARHAYFGHDEWEAVAPGLKTIEDATAIRRGVLLAFERAERRDGRGRAPRGC